MYLRVLVKPGSKEQQFFSEGNELKVYLKASPVKGKANKELISFLADVFKLKKTDLEIVKGHKSRDKVVSIMNCSIEYAHNILTLEN
ncbi:MAG: YggU family protein [Candidatus Heimdallarchaeota archaeon]|nr:YggU family protein [Candidatus Heimdallarchaeota archaeon]